MTWDAYNRRKDALREMLAIADRRAGELTLAELLDAVEGGREAFADETELLLDLQMTWFQRLSGQLDRLVSEGGETPEIATIAAWAAAAGEMPGARALLDLHAGDPGLRKALSKEFVLLAASAGVPAHHPDVSGHGRRLQVAARQSVVRRDVIEPEQQKTVRHKRGSGGLVARLRGHLAA